MDPVNKSQFIADSLLEKIRSKQLCGRIPSDKKIAEEYHVALMTARASDPERLHELCELTLSPEFQQKVTRNKFGIAMDRGVAVSSMNTSSGRDDFYFSEVKNIRFSHYDYELDTLQEIALLVTDFQKNVIDGTAFEKGLRKAVQMQIQTEKRRRRFSLLN